MKKRCKLLHYWAYIGSSLTHNSLPGGDSKGRKGYAGFRVKVTGLGFRSKGLGTLQLLMTRVVALRTTGLWHMWEAWEGASFKVCGDKP